MNDDLEGQTINPVGEFATQTELTLGMLQKATQLALSPEQRYIAVLSGLEIAEKGEVTILDFVEAWENSPELSAFAKELRKVFLLK